MHEAVVSGASDDQIHDVLVRSVAALAATALDVLDADAYILGTPANLGYMSGALKHFFDQIYYPCLETTMHRPFGVYVHGTTDVDGALVSIDKVITGLRWVRAQAPVAVLGTPGTDDLERCWELGASIAAGLTLS